MQKTPDTFSDLIGEWGIQVFADDIEVKYSTANAMKQRNAVAAEYWPRIARAAVARGFPIRAEDLLQIQERSKVSA